MEKKIKHIGILLLFFICCYSGNAQQIDTLKIYACRSRSISCRSHSKDDVGKCIYKINGHRVSQEKGELVESFNCKLERCGDTTKHLFFVKMHDLKDQLLYTCYTNRGGELYWGQYKKYYKSGKVKLEGQYLAFDEKTYHDEKSWGVKTGIWTYYSRKGKVKKIKKYVD